MAIRSTGVTATVRGRSGTSANRKMPDTRNATIATTMARRSLESAGAVVIGFAWAWSVSPAIAV